MSSASLGGSAFRRWQFGALEESGREPRPSSATEAERAQRSAREEGYRAGYEEGRKQAEAEVARLAMLAAALGRELAACEAVAARGVIELALALAQQMVHAALRLRPELVLPLVHAALRELPPFNRDVRLVLHPADAALVRRLAGQALEQEGVRLLEDATLERGGVRLLGSATAVDATLATRWQRLATLFAPAAHWIEFAPQEPPGPESP
jgi:flagellar assembly protein FliH